ncbi:hypothetical protein [Pelagibacterium lacus]|uniref:Uncharacterized protein n=1 Tax=Pelagibacterium lacus TaxID=2282655 RepID=A0A369W6J6_9HYPH|nr:hypothetical protein [Pelagibacterium lacus]RDE10306.1 hypothetical protein DVH29_02670 [Pelagibacterium lacus]
MPRLLSALLALPLLAACGDTAPQSDASQPADAFYVGVWAADPAWCTDQSEGFPITIEADRFLGRENTCDMSAITTTPEDGWTAALSCIAEGTTIEEPVVFSPAGDQLAIIWPDRGPDATLFSRCE